MPLVDVTLLHLNREWSRLLKTGGHMRRDKTPRPMSAKTVRNIAGVVSSAFSRAIKWGLLTSNPVTNSEPPRVKKHLAIALTPAQQEMVLDAASGPWCMRTYLEMASATGCRRGELLALRWSDIVDGCAIIARSLTQTNGGLEFKSTKTEKPRPVLLPESAAATLKVHRKRQDEFHHQFGADYRADLDLIFANPDGSPLNGFHLGNRIVTVQTPEDPEAQGRRTPPLPSFPHVRPACRRRSLACRVRSPGA